MNHVLFCPLPPEVSKWEHNPRIQRSMAVALLVMRAFVAETKKFIEDEVKKELSPLLASHDPVAMLMAEERRSSLTIWSSCEAPFSYDDQALIKLTSAISPDVSAAASGLPWSKDTAAMSWSSFGRRLYAIGKAPSSNSIPAPILSNGTFIHTLRQSLSIIRDLTPLSSTSSTTPESTQQSFVESILSAATKELRIHHVPWCKDRVPTRGRPFSRIVHNVWLSIGKTETQSAKHNAPPPDPLTELGRATIITQVSFQTQLDDPSGPWTASQLSIKDLHTILHKTVLPTDFNIADSLRGAKPIVVETYQWVASRISFANRSHRLFVLIAIIISRCAPNVRCPTGLSKYFKSAATNPSLLLDAIRSIQLIETPEGHNGTRDQSSYITMVPLAALALSDPSSPIRQHQGASKDWTNKHSTYFTSVSLLSLELLSSLDHKCITAFLFVRFSLFTPKTHTIFASGRLMRDYVPKTEPELNQLYKEVAAHLTSSDQYGPYKAVSVIAGPLTAYHLGIQGEYPLPPIRAPVPFSPSSNVD